MSMKTEAEWLSDIQAGVHPGKNGKPEPDPWLRELRARLNRIPAAALQLGAHDLHYRDRAGTVRDVKSAYDALMHIGEHLSYAEATARLCVLFPAVASGEDFLPEPQAMKDLPLDDQRILRAVRTMFAAIGDRRVRILAVDPDEEDKHKAGRHLFPKGSRVNSWGYEDVARTLDTLKFFNRQGYGIYAMPPEVADYAVIVVDDIANPGLVAEAGGRRFGRTEATAEKYALLTRPNLYMRTSPAKTQGIFVIDGYDLRVPDVRQILLEMAQEENAWHGDIGVNNLTHAFRVPGFMNTKERYKTKAEDGRKLQPIVKIEGEPHTGMSEYIRSRIDETQREPAAGLECAPSPRIWPGPDSVDARLVGAWLRATDETFARAPEDELLDLAESLASFQPDSWKATVARARMWAVAEHVRVGREDAEEPASVAAEATVQTTTPEVPERPAPAQQETALAEAFRPVQDLKSVAGAEWTWERAKVVASVAQRAEDALPAVSAYGMALGFVPLALRTDTLCRAAVESAAAALRFVPEALRTPELCSVAVEKDVMLLSGEDYDCGGGADVIGPRPADAVRKPLVPKEGRDAVLEALFRRKGALGPYKFLRAQASAEGLSRDARLSAARVWTVAVRIGVATIADLPPDADLRATVEAALGAGVQNREASGARPDGARADMQAADGEDAGHGCSRR